MKRANQSSQDREYVLIVTVTRYRDDYKTRGRDWSSIEAVYVCETHAGAHAWIAEYQAVFVSDKQVEDDEECSDADKTPGELFDKYNAGYNVNSILTFNVHECIVHTV